MATKPGLYANIQKKRERIANGSGERMRKVGTAGAPTKQAFIDSAKTAKKATGGSVKHDKPIAHKTTGSGKTYNPTEKGAGMTAKGRAEYNRKNGSNLKAPAPHPKTESDKGRKASFCARMEGVVKKAKGPATRAKASLKNWNC